MNIVKTFIANGTITEYALVSVDTAGKVGITTAGTSVKVVGVAQRAASAGDVVDVLIFGETRVIAGGTIDPNTEPRLAAVAAGTGKVEAVTSGKYPVCRMIPNVNQESAVANDQIVVLFTGPSIIHA